MKKIILLFALSLMAFVSYAQKDIFEKYTEEKRYTEDGGNIVVSKVVDNLSGSKEDIFMTVKAYLARAYNDSKSVIQTQDKDAGLIIAKGLYPEFHSFSLGTWTLKAYHTIRVDIKEGRARIICSANGIIPNSSQHMGDKTEYSIVNHYPITSKRAPYITKGTQAKGVVMLIDLMHGSVDQLAQVLEEGGALNTEKEDW